MPRIYFKTIYIFNHYTNQESTVPEHVKSISICTADKQTKCVKNNGIKKILISKIHKYRW